MRTPARSVSILLSLAAGAAGCAEDLCKEKPASIELHVRAPGMPRVGSLSVTLSIIGEAQYQRVFDTGAQLDDGATSLVIELAPEPADNFQAEVSITAHSATGGAGDLLAINSQRFNGTSDACNVFEISLARVEGDSGVPPDAADAADAALDDVEGADVAPEDVPDAGEPDVLDQDAADEDAFVDDAEVPDALLPDAGVPVLYPYTPSNFDPATLYFGPAVNLSCGATEFNTSTLVFTNWCNDQPVPYERPQVGGPDVVILAIAALNLDGASSLTVTGTRSLILAIGGNATLLGTIELGANDETAGPGGSDDSQCAGMGSGGDGASQGGGGGGGGGGGFGEAGGTGGEPQTGANGGTAGGQSGVDTLVPLRGGCGGGDGGEGDQPGGGGGGALQISAAGDVSVSGRILSGGGGGAGGNRRQAGGGGGSGGAILIEGVQIDLLAASVLAANGGGGGEGGPELNVSDGEDGSDAAENGGNGGDNGNFQGGNGGDGQDLNTTPAGDGNNGTNQRAGGGGGGGGVGRIRLNGSNGCTRMGTVSPAPTGNGTGGCP